MKDKHFMENEKNTALGRKFVLFKTNHFYHICLVNMTITVMSESVLVDVSTHMESDTNS